MRLKRYQILLVLMLTWATTDSGQLMAASPPSSAIPPVTDANRLIFERPSCQWSQPETAQDVAAKSSVSAVLVKEVTCQFFITYRPDKNGETSSQETGSPNKLSKNIRLYPKISRLYDQSGNLYFGTAAQLGKSQRSHFPLMRIFPEIPVNASITFGGIAVQGQRLPLLEVQVHDGQQFAFAVFREITWQGIPAPPTPTPKISLQKTVGTLTIALQACARFAVQIRCSLNFSNQGTDRVLQLFATSSVLIDSAGQLQEGHQARLANQAGTLPQLNLITGIPVQAEILFNDPAAHAWDQVEFHIYTDRHHHVPFQKIIIDQGTKP